MKIQNIKTKIEYTILISLYAFLVFLILGSAYSYAEWNRTWELRFQNPIQNFIIIKPRPVTQSNPVVKRAQAKEPKDMTTEEYICHVFKQDCKMALAISRAENGTRQCDRFGVNTNKTIDIGIFQINSVHLNKGYTLADLMNCKTNIDIAHKLYSEQGWQPWVTYKNDSYKQFLN